MHDNPPPVLNGRRVPWPVWHRAGLALVVFVLLAGGIYSLVLPRETRYQDEQEYLKLAQNLVHGPGFSLDGSSLTASRPPGFSFFLAGIQALGGGFVAVRLIHYLLMAATILLAARLLPFPGPRAATLPVAGLVILYPALFYIAGTLYPQTLAGFLFIAALVLLLAKGRGTGPLVVAGTLFGTLILVAPTFGFTLTIVLAAALALHFLRWRGALAVFFAASLVVGAWTVRNWVEFRQFVPIASNSGINFLIGNNPDALPYGGVNTVDLSRYLDVVQARHLDEFQADHYFVGASLGWIRQHPEHAGILYLEKTLNFFNLWNKYSPSSAQEITPWEQWLMGASYLFLLALVAWRLVEAKTFPLSPEEKLLLIVYVASAFTSAIFLTRIRFRLPYDYLPIAIAASHLVRRLAPGLSEEKTGRATAGESRPASRPDN